MIGNLPDVSVRLLPRIPDELRWPFTVVMVLFVIAIHIHLYMRR